MTEYLSRKILLIIDALLIDLYEVIKENVMIKNDYLHEPYVNCCT